MVQSGHKQYEFQRHRKSRSHFFTLELRECLVVELASDEKEKGLGENQLERGGQCFEVCHPMTLAVPAPVTCLINSLGMFWTPKLEKKYWFFFAKKKSKRAQT